MPDDNITVLILNRVKKIRSLKVNRKRIRFAIIFSVTFIALFALSLGTNFYLYRQNKDISAQLSQFQSTENIADTPLSDDYDGADGVYQTHSRPAGTVNNESDSNNREENSETGKPVNIFDGDFDSDIVGIRDLTYSLELNKIELSIQFNVVKKNRTDEAYSGNIFVVAATSDENMPHVCWPTVNLNEKDLPFEHRRGNPFTIKFLKPVEANILLNNPAERYYYFRIYVFSRDSGELLLLKTTRIETQ